MLVRFIDRQDELRILDSIWSSGKPGFVVVYGRRRIGKTRLLVEWARDKPHVYVQCLSANDEVNLARISTAAAEQLGIKEFRNTRFRGLDDLLMLLSRVVKGRLIIILDEFTYWARRSGRMLGELQYFIDHQLPRTGFLLVVSGSLVGVVHRDILGYGSPLYGRRTAALRVGELKPWHVKEFLRVKDKADRVRVYALVGGLPYYLSYIYGSRSLREVLVRLFGTRISPIYDEPIMLFREEFRNPETYYSIVYAIAHGYNRLSQIADYTGIPRTHLPKYLRLLSTLGYIEYVVPLFTRKGWYRVRDPIMRTWFMLLEPRLHMAETGRYEELINSILGSIDAFTGPVFEEIAKQYILENADPSWLGSRTRVGRYLHRGVEIDLVVLSEERRRALAYEFKWSDLDEREARRIHAKLWEKIRQTPLRNYSVETYIVARKAPLLNHVITLDEMPV
jgi:AAA+ ATPase superfamily predicted ATPase